MNRYTQYDRKRALDVSFIDICQYFGFRVTRIGHYYSLKEMDSIRIYNDKTFYRFSGKSNKGATGGTVIDFMLEYCGYDDVPSCIEFLLEFQNLYFERKEIQTINTTNKTSDTVSEVSGIELPEKNNDYKRAFAYLIKTRGISQDVVQYFVDNKLLYEDIEHHNLVFLGYDKDKKLKYATKHGTNSYHDKAYRGDVEGSDKDHYGVSLHNSENGVVHIFESVIDMMSYITMWNEILDYDYIKDFNGLAMGGTNCYGAIDTYINEYNISTLYLHLDMDDAGLKASDDIYNRYKNNCYRMHIDNVLEPLTKEVKDYNDLLLKLREDNSLDYFDCFIYSNDIKQVYSEEQV
ncbi:MAG: DUF3991 domain-containing protein [Lachnospiraceae bacterium]|nr:DUF3991 domain-containing protein [Lachnospiraceae bacterium]